MATGTLGFLLSSGLITSTVLLDFAILFALVYVVWNVLRPAYRIYKDATDLDEKAGPVPKHWFFGHSKEFSHTHAGILRRAKLTASHPTMFHQWLAPFLTNLSIHHPDTATSLLSSGAPKNETVYSFLRPWLGDGLLLTNGPKWQRHRQLLTPAFHFSILKIYAKVTGDCVDVMLDKWMDQTGRALEISEDVNLMTLDSLLQCAMSADTKCQKVRKHPFPHAVREMTRIIVKRLQTPYLMPNFIFWRSAEGKLFKKHIEIVHTQGKQVIAERRAALKVELEKNPDPEEAEQGFVPRSKKKLDFLDILLRTKDEHGNGLTDIEILDEVNTFLAAGSDSTASAVSWGLYNLAKHPEIQEKCRDEVLKVLQGREDIEWNDLSKLTYLTMFVKENLRMYPPAYIISKKLHQPLTLRSKLNRFYETVVPKGTNAGLHIFALHWNERLWENPSVFDPERFTKENIAKRSPHAYLPFSAGSRNCIGQNFAMNEIKIAMAKALQRYRLYLDEECPEPVLEPILTLQSKHGIFIKLERRNWEK